MARQNRFSQEVRERAVRMVEFLREADLMIQKIPEQLELIEALPRNPSGKVVKRELQDRFDSREA